MLFAACLAFGVTFACLLVLTSPPARQYALDLPNERSMHVAPVPRTGGLAIATGVAASLALYGTGQFAVFWISLALVGLSFLDDVFGLPALIRLGAHFAASAGALALWFPHADPIALVVSFLAIAWMVNAYNFMDGSDGMAGGMAVIGFGAYAAAAHIEGIGWLALACIAICSAALAFLLFNFSPARIFMGDSGSIALGFLAGVLGVAGCEAGAWGPWFPVLVFSPFLVDATLTLFKRLARREKVWLAHREHYYQRLVRMGFTQRTTALGWYVLMMTCVGVALFVRQATPSLQMAALGSCAAMYVVLALWVDARWARHASGALQ